MEEVLATREEMKNEALRRLKKLGYIPQAIKAFEKNDIVMVSERTSVGCGILYDLEGGSYDKALQNVKDVEEEYGGLVYAVIRDVFSESGTIYSFLYVSKHKEEWCIEEDGLNNGVVFAYCYNDNDQFLSEFGDIKVKGENGGLRRVA